MVGARHPALLPDPVEHLRRSTGYGNPLKILGLDEDVRRLALERVKARLHGVEWKGAPTSEYEVSTLLIALASVSASKLALTRFLDAEVGDAISRIQDEDLSVLIEVAQGLGIRVTRGGEVEMPWLISRGRVYYRRLDISAPVSDVLENARISNVTSLFMLKGRVYLDRKLLLEVIAGAARKRLEDLAREIAPLIPGLDELADRIKDLAEETASRPRGLVEEALPSCIKALIARGRTGRGLSDEEVYVLATFMANIGAGPQILEEVLAKSGLAPPELAPSIASILIEEASSYKPYNCKTLDEMGLCSCRGSLLLEYSSNLHRSRAGS